MKVLILEDEYHAAKLLQKLILEVEPTSEILTVLDSIEDALVWFKEHSMPDLIFMDIQLADGLSLDLFNHIEITRPIIFTTAYDQYTLRAFKVNSVDYLLKPIGREELETAFEKYWRYHQSQNQGIDSQQLQSLLQQFTQPKNFKSRFLVKQGQSWHFVETEDVAYIYSEDGLTFLLDKGAKRHLVDSTIEQLSKELNPSNFFRINRKQIIRASAIQQIQPYFNHRLKLMLYPKSHLDNIVARDKVKGFKEWLDG